MYKYLLPLIVFVFSACHQGKVVKNKAESTDTVAVKYATGFSLIHHPDYEEAVVHNPWNKSTETARYYLVRNEGIQVPENGVKIIVPLQNLAVSSSTHFEFLHLIGELSKVNGICSPELVYNADIRQKYADGKIVNLGDALQMDIEKLVQLQPKALMMSGYNQDDPYSKRAIQSGIKVIFNQEWMEQSVLGRAEWIKFVAAFFNKEKLADSLFTAISDRYNLISEKAQKTDNHPKILSGSNFRGIWYMPGGRSYMAGLFKDAGASYYFANDTSSGSLPLNVEKVTEYFSNADVWVNCNFNSIDALLKADEKHRLFKPVQSGRVFNFNARMLPGGANDFWESAVAHPDVLLNDYISIVHPELVSGYQPFYIQKLK